jgi:predicted amidohydrolase YtcJ
LVLMLAADVLHPLAAHASDDIAVGLDLGIRTGLGDDRLRVRPVNIFTDGSLIGHTCAMTEDSADTPGERGYLQDDADALRERILQAHRSGWRVAAHAIGDAAIDLVLDAVEEAQRRWPRPDVRHRIEHYGVSRPDQVARAAALGVVPVPQGRFIGEIGDGMLRALGPERSGWAYRYRSLLDAGLTVPGSSDRPVVDGTPLRGIHDMVNRLTDSGQPCGPEEAISGLEALTAYTHGSAYASHAEGERGTIVEGAYADLAVLSDDPATVDPTTIKDLEVLRTVLAGEVVWQR